MIWLSKIPRHLNRCFWSSMFIHLISKLLLNILFISGLLTASITLLFVCLPFVLIVFIGWKSVHWIKIFIIHYRYPSETVIDINRKYSSFQQLREDYLTFLTTINGIINEDDVIRKLYLQYSEQQNKHFDSFLKHKIKCRLGLPVWCPDTEFSVKNHIFTYGNRYKGKLITMSNIKEVVASLCNFLPEVNKSPWSIHLIYIHRSSPRKADFTAVFVRAHHFLTRTFSTSIVHLFDQITSSPTSLFKLTANPVKSYCLPVFFSNSVTSKITRQWLALMIETISLYKAKCDPNDHSLDYSDDILWLSIRKLVKILKNVNQKLQKFNDCLELSTNPTYRASWSRSTTLANMAPRLLCSVLDRLWEIKFKIILKRLVSITVSQLPGWSFRMCWCLFLKCCATIMSTFHSLTKSNKFLVLFRIKQIIKEFQFTIKCILLFPFLVFKGILTTDSRVSIFDTNVNEPTLATIAWSENIPLTTVYRIADLTDSNVTQVLLSVTLGAITQYIQENNLKVPEMKISIPISKQNYSMKINDSVDGYLQLLVSNFVGLSGYERLMLIKKTTFNNKIEFNYFLNLVFYKYIAAILPNFIYFYFSNALKTETSLKLYNTTIFMRNRSLTVCNKVIEFFHCWKYSKEPTLNLVTYRDHVSLVITGNNKNLPHPEKIASHFIKEFTNLAVKTKAIKRLNNLK